MAEIQKQRKNGYTKQRTTTDNLMQIISAERIRITLIQEPYLYQNRLIGIKKVYRTFSFGEGKSRTAIVITNTTTDALLITQMSDDAVLLEINRNTCFYADSMYECAVV
jgi:hypothetical protein